WGPGQRMTDAAVRVLGGAKGIGDETDYGFDTNLSILGAFLGDGKSATFTKTLEQGRDYVILGGGDQSIVDLDLEVSDEFGNLVAVDQIGATPIVKFRATFTGRFTLKATAHKADRGGFCCVVILRKNGWKVPVKNLADALGALMQQCDSLDRTLRDKTREKQY